MSINKDLSKTSQVQGFTEVVDIIVRHRSKASRAVNEQSLLCAWNVGGYVSKKLKSEEWGSKVVTQLSEYIRSKYPDIKGFSKRNLYNMVMFYDEYSSETFAATIRKYISDKFVQSETAQIEKEQSNAIIVQSGTAQFVQLQTGQMPNILTLTTLTNHIEILCRCKSVEERLFYILYAHKEQLLVRELQRCISNQTYSALLSDKTNLSKGLLHTNVGETSSSNNAR